MTPHFRSYVSNLLRIRFAELVDHHATVLRHGRARPSLIVHPLTGLPYPEKADGGEDQPPPHASVR
ncbi:hypothetical protein HYPDE_31803 [Hyphomicrobium denitrificans 1NES1]|uniref:Uncharacterized protein n=1 Tax=Hyphomicrobium denitrificans 1NES1 TaxID=670307 RepID=N0BD38_9HYPH|nr:hypothetical protein [Hyphomicrobium denitrificans]AGK58035.1 hypothetical protein HYPDE_31803 [Hyphomicrobium denitrificans 1NES1]